MQRTIRDLNSMIVKPVLLSLLPALFGACTATQGVVPSHPPVISDQLKASVLSQYGTLRPDVISVFLWPLSWNEDETAKNVYIINRDAQENEDLSKKMIPLGLKLQAMWTEFKDKEQCIVKYADMSTIPDPDLVQESDDITWKDVTSRADQDALAKCQANQAARAPIRSAMAAISTEQQPLLAEIAVTLDPQYPDKIENSLSITAQGSEIVIKSGISRNGNGESTSPAVDVTLADFLRPNNTQTTTKGTIVDPDYNVQTGVLSFAVPELATDGVTPTGRTYQFVLYRGDNLFTDASIGIEYACFKGNVFLMNGNRVVRSGKAEIAGFLR